MLDSSEAQCFRTLGGVMLKLSSRDYEMIIAGAAGCFCAGLIFLVVSAWIAYPVNWDALSAIGTVIAVVVAIWLPILERRRVAQEAENKRRSQIRGFMSRLQQALDEIYVNLNMRPTLAEPVGFLKESDFDVCCKLEDTTRTALIEARGSQGLFDDVTAEHLIRCVDSIYALETRGLTIASRFEHSSLRVKSLLVKTFDNHAKTVVSQISVLSTHLVPYGAGPREY